MTRIFGIGCCVSLCVCTVPAAVIISNVSATQREGTKLVDIRYDVSSDVTNMVDVSVRIANGSQDVAAYAFTGAIGEGITTGTNKLIVWNAGVDQSNIAATVQVHLIIDDGASDPNIYISPCPVPQTGQTNSYAVGDDGDLRAGITSPWTRMVYAADGTYIDLLTGLQWAYISGASDYPNWSQALDQCNSLSRAGFDDWRLPTVCELLTLEGSVFNKDTAWSSTTDCLLTNQALVVYVHVNATNMYENAFYSSDKSETFAHATFAVRTYMQGDAYTQVPASGQTVSYHVGDDGDLHPGSAWPNPRFIDNGETVTDRLTGLEWLKNANAFGLKQWGESLNICNELAVQGHADWRLPNKFELRSLIDFGALNPCLPQDQPFTNVQSVPYWTSTTANYPYLETGVFSGEPAEWAGGAETNSLRGIWPVRGGE